MSWTEDEKSSGEVRVEEAGRIEIDPVAERKLVRKLDWIILPLFSIICKYSIHASLVEAIRVNTFDHRLCQLRGQVSLHCVRMNTITNARYAGFRTAIGKCSHAFAADTGTDLGIQETPKSQVCLSRSCRRIRNLGRADVPVLPLL